MTSRTSLSEPAGSTVPDRAKVHLRPLTLSVLSAWCGLISGVVEVGAILVRKQTFDTNRLYGMSRHFVWLIPVTNLCLFLSLGVASGLAILIWPRRGSWLAVRWLCALAILPPLLVAFPQVHGVAWLVLALGISARLVPWLERHLQGFRRLVRASFPVIAALVPLLAASFWVSDRLKSWREETRPLPLPGSPNVLLIVLDTMAADHSSLYGYSRPTSPTLEELAARGIRFNAALATSSWTLPSHASMLTGRLPHEFSANWLTPLDGVHPTLAEFLGSQGYATAGFVANTLYCATDSGLDRGFTEYWDYIFPNLTMFRMAVLVSRSVTGLQEVGRFLATRLDCDLLQSLAQHLWWLFNSDRKEAAVVNRDVIHWLARRRPERPFFAFLNFYDAHYPYQLAERGIRRFGVAPRDSRESELIQDWWPFDKRGVSAKEIAFVRDAYDDCVAELDEQLGCLIDELAHRGILERTWVIIAADHGESFGEHAGVFCHGASLYQTELHVPLMVLPPAVKSSLSGRVVDATVSLRDVAATVVELVGLEAGSPFPGKSLAGFWDDSSPAPTDPVAGGWALAEVIPNDPLINFDRAQMLKPQWPLATLAKDGWTYIRREGEIREELFNLREDAQQQHNLAGAAAMRSRLERMRKNLSRLTAGPLTPQRFHP